MSADRESAALEALARVLEGADAGTLGAVVAVIDGLPQRGELGHLLDRIRPRLAELRPPRPMSVRRVLTVPLEFLLVPAERWEPGSYRIPRTHLGAIHRLALEGAGAETERFEEAVRGRTMDESAHVLRVGGELWPAAAAALKAAMERGTLRALDPHTRISVRLAHHALALGSELVPCMWMLPQPPIFELDAATGGRLTMLAEAALQHDPEALLMVVDAFAERCETPVAVLGRGLEEALGDAAEGVLRHAAVVVTRFVDRTLATLDRLLREPDAPHREIRAVLRRVACFLDTHERLPRPCRPDGYSLRQLRRRAAELAEAAVSRLLGRELPALMRGARVDDRTVAEAEAIARTVALVAAIAPLLGVKAKVDLQLRRAESAMLAAIEAAHDDGAVALEPPQELVDRLRLVEILFGSRRAAELWRRLVNRAA